MTEAATDASSGVSLLSARAIASVAAAIVAGNDRPYCTTLMAPSTLISGRTAPLVRRSSSRPASSASDASVRRRKPSDGREDLGEEQGVGRPIGRGRSSPCSGRAARSPPGRPRGHAQRPVHQVDAPGPLGVDAVAQRRRLLDGAGHVGERAVADVRGQGVEQQVDGDVRARSAATSTAARREARRRARRRRRSTVAAGSAAAGGGSARSGRRRRGGRRRRRRRGRAAGPAAAAMPASRMASAARRSRRTRSAGSGESRLASSHERAADAGAPRWAVTAAAASRALATSSSGPTAARARCHARAGESGGSVPASARWAARRSARDASW